MIIFRQLGETNNAFMKFKYTESKNKFVGFIKDYIFDDAYTIVVGAIITVAFFGLAEIFKFSAAEVVFITIGTLVAGIPLVLTALSYIAVGIAYYPVLWYNNWKRKRDKLKNEKEKEVNND